MEKQNYVPMQREESEMGKKIHHIVKTQPIWWLKCIVRTKGKVPAFRGWSQLESKINPAAP